MGMQHAEKKAALARSSSAASDELQSIARHAPLIEQAVLEHGPVALVGRFVLKAEQAARRRGVTLSIEPIGALGAFTREHLPTWPPLPMFDPVGAPFTDDRAFCIMGRDANRKIVATQAVRVYEWPTSCLREAAETLSLFYGSAEPPQSAKCRMGAASGQTISGIMAYSGGGWYAPAYRGQELSAILPRLSRALALSRWNTDYTVSFVDWQLVRKGVVARYGYKNIENGVRIEGMIGDPFDAALVWMGSSELLEDLAQFLETFDDLSGSLAQNRRAD